ncbi:hypothetical protein Ms3S1_22950 [Methylosinus sp. 3S-1]
MGAGGDAGGENLAEELVAQQMRHGDAAQDGGGSARRKAAWRKCGFNSFIGITCPRTTGGRLAQRGGGDCTNPSPLNAK